MNKTRIALLLIVIAALFATGCREKIDIKLDKSYTRLVVEGALTDEVKAHTIKLTETSDYFSNQAAPMAQGAEVTLFFDSQAITLTETQPGIYQTPSDFQGVPGKDYSLKISYGEKDYEAHSALRVMGIMDSIQCLPVEDREGYYNVNIFAQETPQAGEYYLWLLYKNNKLETDTMREVISVSDELVNGNYIWGMTVYQPKAEPGDTIDLEMYSISKEYYDFIYALQMESGMYGGSFSGPPANIKGNISNGALGFFQASAISRVRKIIR